MLFSTRWPPVYVGFVLATISTMASSPASPFLGPTDKHMIMARQSATTCVTRIHATTTTKTPTTFDFALVAMSRDSITHIEFRIGRDSICRAKFVRTSFSVRSHYGTDEVTWKIIDKCNVHCATTNMPQAS